uniref:Uncharacterized protein n=1 Tax=Palpitomonas bilix TaxID=652834 RepID=A0A7S3DBW6_9EUKA|mmetsp:Transcript_30265/g.78277  ORF Transcript_30265/g.78277 Transcript_30265/m.78277 type:complete len:775 (+) Transcript_30265:234-2558(+)
MSGRSQGEGIDALPPPPSAVEGSEVGEGERRKEKEKGKERPKSAYKEKSARLRAQIKARRAQSPTSQDEVKWEVFATADAPPQRQSLAADCSEEDMYTVQCKSDSGGDNGGSASSESEAKLVELKYPKSQLCLSPVLKTMLDAESQFKESESKVVQFVDVQQCIVQLAFSYLELEYFNPGVDFHFEVKAEHAFDLLNFAHFLNAQKLTTLCCQMVGHYIVDVPALNELSEDLLHEILPHCSALDLVEVERNPDFFPPSYSTMWIWERLYHTFLENTSRLDRVLFMPELIEKIKPSAKEQYGCLYVQDKVNAESTRRKEELIDAVDLFGDLVFQLQARDYLVKMLGGVEKMIERFPNIHSLDLNSSNLGTPEKMQNLAEALLARTPFLTYLELSSCNITSSSLLAFFEVILAADPASAPPLLELSLALNKIGPKGASAVASYLGSIQGRGLQVVDLNLNPIGEVGFTHIMYGVGLQKKRITMGNSGGEEGERGGGGEGGVKELLLHGCDITMPVYPHYLCEAMHTSDVEKLLLSQNPFRKGAPPLEPGTWVNEGSDVVRRNYSTTTHLSKDRKAKWKLPTADEKESAEMAADFVPILLRDSDMRLDGERELTASFFTHLPHNLKHLDLSSCRLSEPELRSLVGVLGEEIHSLESLNLHSNPAQASYSRPLSKIILSNPHLSVLNVSNTAVGSEDFEMVEEAIARSHSLSNLNMSYCGIDSGRVEALLERLINATLSGMHSIPTVSIQGNGFIAPQVGMVLQQRAKDVGLNFRVSW